MPSLEKVLLAGKFLKPLLRGIGSAHTLRIHCSIKAEHLYKYIHRVHIARWTQQAGIMGPIIPRHTETKVVVLVKLRFTASPPGSSGDLCIRPVLTRREPRPETAEEPGKQLPASSPSPPRSREKVKGRNIGAGSTTQKGRTL